MSVDAHNLIMRAKTLRVKGDVLTVLVLLLALSLFSGSASGRERLDLVEWAERPLTGQIMPPPWKLKKKSGIPDLSLIVQGENRIIRLRSNRASFSAERKLKFSVDEYPVLSWKWMVTQLPENGDFRDSRRDDQAAQLFVMFGKSRAIVYIWDSNAPKGMISKIRSPPFVDLRVMVLRSGPEELGEWIVERRDLRRDYDLVFGSKPIPNIKGVRIQINSQHTGSLAESFFSDLHLDRGNGGE